MGGPNRAAYVAPTATYSASNFVQNLLMQRMDDTDGKGAKGAEPIVPAWMHAQQNEFMFPYTIDCLSQSTKLAAATAANTHSMMPRMLVLGLIALLVVSLVVLFYWRAAAAHRKSGMGVK